MVVIDSVTDRGQSGTVLLVCFCGEVDDVDWLTGRWVRPAAARPARDYRRTLNWFDICTTPLPHKTPILFNKKSAPFGSRTRVPCCLFPIMEGKDDNRYTNGAVLII